ncbi:Part of AAA domain-containing protein [Variovorax sp. OV329]|nr:Part of AAA domain-containing protein [Variovorax sp. OV329]
MFCSALEQAGLNPILVFTKGHAFAGVWLKADQFSTTVVDDVTALRKRIKLKELVVFETTFITQRPSPSFTYATQRGAEQVGEAVEESFELVVDIRRARMQRIKPLASAETVVVQPAVDQVAVGAELTFDEAPDLPDEGQEVETDSAALNPKDRLARWQRKLLDLSLRNNLLNFKAGKKALKLEAPDASLLEDALAEGQILKILPRPDLMDGADPRSQAIYESREREDVRRTHALDALRRKEVFVGVPKDELEARLVELFRTARTTMQEGGSNTLYLALGFLSWTREEKSEQKYRAPLILVPVTLSRKSARSGFTLAIHDDEPRFNPTLIEMLRQDFHLNLGVSDSALPMDDRGLDVQSVWRAVSSAIKDIKGWEVSEEVILSMFSFAKYLMWKDLTERTDQLRQNAVVRHLIDSPRDNYPSGVAFPSPRELDREFGPEQTFCPLPADSSQLSAVMAAVRGKDFVLIGPPGTGKSQTIANLIAQCLAEGKRVLFVSEKIAALDVVYRRLREVKLGEFCLELHSSKARKLDVLAQLKNSWEAKGDVDPEVWRAEARRLKAVRDELNSYVERLHFRFANGMTIYEAIGRVVDGEAIPRLGLSWSVANAHDATTMDLMRSVAERLDVNANAVGYDGTLKNPLADVGHSEWSPKLQQDLVRAAHDVLPAAHALTSAYERFTTACGFPPLSSTRTVRGGMGVLARALPGAAGRDWSFAVRSDARRTAERLRLGIDLIAQHRQLSSALSAPWSPSIVASCKRGMTLIEQRRALYARIGKPWTDDVVSELRGGLKLLDELAKATDQLSVRYGEQIEHLNVSQLQREFAKAEKAVWPVSFVGKRKVRQALESCVTGEGEPDVAADLRHWIRIRSLRAEAEALQIGPAVEGVWAGLKTRSEFVQAALKFQSELEAAKSGRQWNDAGLDAVANGRCGVRLEDELKNLRTLRALDEEIASLEGLSAPTSSLWSGLATDVGNLAAALDFNAALDRVRTSGALADAHELVAAGVCGHAMAADLQALQRRASIELSLTELTELKVATCGLWDGLDTKTDECDKALRFHASVSTAIANLASGPEDADAVAASLARLLAGKSTLLEPSGEVHLAAQRYLSDWLALQPKIDQLGAAGAFSEPSKAHFSEISLNDLIDRCNEIIRAEPRLNAWCAWRKVRDQASRLGLSGVVAGIENGAVKPGTVLEAFETNYSRWWLNAVVDNEPVIRTFVAAEHEKRIGDFRALEARHTDLTRAWIRASLCADLPKQDTVTRGSEWGLLRHEMAKKTKHLPLRELMSSIPTALTKLTPCLLMSPLSIAQYLSADANTFDVVVFDEASQIPVWDAVGAIARGKQVVMVGDPKQLPPTSFFDRAESSSDDEEEEGDLESILDECMGANLPTMNLSWHYRSRHESLIAFSNHRYYGGSLVTFPAPVTVDRAVSFHYVAGAYEKGGARINKAEAKAVVADIVAKLRDPGFRQSGRTIGVVTFNSEQQALIEDLLDEERRSDPSLEPYFAELELEPLFVKNLESVQGDERDIMYFSITYGPDLSGSVSMNFGPMNREGGERRLNVAITRARQELRVFSSLKAEKMDLARTQARGVRDLKHFLEFAERGTKALAEATSGSLGGFESPFEEAVATALASKGWELHTQIGASSFRVDLAVVHPDARGTYLTGVECDGATYHRSATARDRDMLREQVLRGLGWEIVRVWSTDWWVDRASTLEKLDIKLNDLLARSRAARAEAAEREAARHAAREAIEKAKEDLGSSDAVQVSGEPAGAALGIEGLEAPLASTVQPEVYARNVAVEDGAPSSRLQYVESDPLSSVQSVIPDDFFNPSYDATLRTMIAHVVKNEGPLLDSVLARRIARAHGWQRTGARIQERVVSLTAKSFESTKDDMGVFYWPSAAGSDADSRFRSSSEDPRPVDEICIEELTALARQVLSKCGGEEAVVAMAVELGLGRIRAATRTRLQHAISLASA